MRLKSALLAFTAVILPWSALQAAPATPDEAQSIKSSLERYVGKGPADGESPVAVTPAGDAYTIAIDLKRALHALEAFGVVVDPAVFTMTATPLDGGTWHVIEGTPPLITVKFRDQIISVVSNGAKFDGIYDPALPAFLQSTNTYDSMSIASTGGPNGTSTRQVANGKQTQSAEKVADGVINGKVALSNSGYSQDIAMDAPAGKAGSPKKLQRVALKSGPTTESLSIDALHIRALADLWAFFVAHPSVVSVKASQTDLRGLLHQALPLFDHWSQSSSLQKFAVDSPIGHFSAESLDAQVAFTGLTADGSAESMIKIASLAGPVSMLPPWSIALVPTDLEIKESVSGYHIAAAAEEAVNSFDLNAPQPFTPEEQAKLKVLLGPTDQIVVHIAPSRIASPLLDIHFEGEVHVTLPLPTFTMTVHATGLDKVVQDIQSKAGQDPNAAQLIAVIILAKGYGKAETDGSLSWVLAGDPFGKMTVNGVELPFGKGK